MISRGAAASNRRSPYGPFLDDLADQINQDRDSLLQIMRALNARVDQLKVACGWGAEKLGRLKLNGQVLGYSPLSRIVELEMLCLGVHGKRGLWRSLQELAAEQSVLAPFGLPQLIARADRQLEALEAFRLEAVVESFEGRRERILPDVLHD